MNTHLDRSILFSRLAVISFSVVSGCAQIDTGTVAPQNQQSEVQAPKTEQSELGRLPVLPARENSGFRIIQVDGLEGEVSAVSAAQTNSKAAVVAPQAAIAPVASRGSRLLGCLSATNYVPIDPFPTLSYSSYNISEESGEVEATREVAWPNEPAEVAALLPNISSDVKVYDLGAQTGIGPFSASRNQKRVVMDFMKYRAEPLKDLNGDFIDFVRVGIGMRLKIDLTTTDGGLDLTSLISLAASARAGETKGRISVDIIGVDSQDITLSAPLSADLSEASIERILQSFAAIRANFNDEKTRMSPQVIALIKCDAEI